MIVRLIAIVGIGLILLLGSPIAWFEWGMPGSFQLDFDDFVAGKLKNITEKQLLNSGFNRTWGGKGTAEFAGRDSIRLDSTAVPALVSLQFINGIALPDHPARADKILSAQRSDVYHPAQMRIVYNAIADTAILASLNHFYDTEQIPAPLNVADLVELLYVAEWQDSTGKGPEIHYTRAAHWGESMLHIEIGRSMLFSWINWYVRTVYRLLPEVLQPNWYKTIKQPLSARGKR